MTLAQRGQRLLLWLLFEPRCFWLATVAPLVVLKGLFLVWPSERGVRVAGFAMTVLGVALAVYGVLETRGLFGQEPYRRRFWRWLVELRGIFGPTRVVNLTGHAVMPGMTASGTATVRAGAKDTSISARLRAVEDNLKRVEAELGATQQQHREDIRADRHDLERSKTEQHTGVSRVAAKLEEYSTGSLDLELVGAVWVAAGQAYGSFPQWFASLLHH